VVAYSDVLGDVDAAEAYWDVQGVVDDGLYSEMEGGPEVHN